MSSHQIEINLRAKLAQRNHPRYRAAMRNSILFTIQFLRRARIGGAA
jgi:hypothetical protein